MAYTQITEQEPAIRSQSVTFRPWEYSARLRKLQRGEWWIWALSMLVQLALTAGIVSLSLPQILQGRKTAAGGGVFQTVLGLIFLILIFISYLTYEKILINRLRFELAEGQFQSFLWQNLALTDPLTGLFNRRFAERQITTEISRAHRRRYPLTLVVFDLNNFKLTNDRFGHLAGDLVLKTFAERLRSVVREGDVAVRLGGDEFLLLLPECNDSRLPAILNRLEGIDVEFGEQRIPVNFSAGSTEYRSGDTSQDLLDRADQALYQDKKVRRQVSCDCP
jgi:diguanylate cyclase (GGDEF)-like protein